MENGDAGLLKTFDADEDGKRQACNEAVHWLPIVFSAGMDPLESCHFYPRKNNDMHTAACYWGNCIDHTDLHATLWESFVRDVLGLFLPFSHLFGRPERVSLAEKCPHLEFPPFARAD